MARVWYHRKEIEYIRSILCGSYLALLTGSAGTGPVQLCVGAGNSGGGSDPFRIKMIQIYKVYLITCMYVYYISKIKVTQTT